MRQILTIHFFNFSPAQFSFFPSLIRRFKTEGIDTVTLVTYSKSKTENRQIWLLMLFPCSWDYLSLFLSKNEQISQHFEVRYHNLPLQHHLLGITTKIKSSRHHDIPWWKNMDRQVIFCDAIISQSHSKWGIRAARCSMSSQGDCHGDKLTVPFN